MADLHLINPSAARSRRLDVVFVHGLGGDPFGTWRSGADEHSSWPHWLATSFGADVAVWSLGYVASPSRWPALLGPLRQLSGRAADPDAGQAMSISRRAENCLDRLVKSGIGQRPCLFIAHSLGGVLVKTILQKSEQAVGAPEEQALIRHCRGVLFLATPHTGSPLASLAHQFRLYVPSITTSDLKDNDDHLLDLYRWYREAAPRHRIETRSYYEDRRTAGVVVVPRDAADPGVSGALARSPKPLDKDHIQISKPLDRRDQAYLESVAMVRRIMEQCEASRQEPAKPGSPPSATATPAEGMGEDRPGRRFAVGFSYAGEDRRQVRAVAELLARKLGPDRVLFDRFHEAELARTDLDVYLPRLYRDQVELIIVVLSPNYQQKRWCGLEWRWIRQLILGPAQDRIMLVQLGDPGDLSDLGILSGDGYLNVADRAAEEIAALIEQRMRQAGIPVPEGSAASAGEAGQPPPPQAGTGAGPEGSAGMAPPLDSEGPQVLDQPGAPEGEKRSEKRARRLPGTLAATVVAVGLGLTGLAVGRPLLARWALAQGDQAFLAYTNEPSRQEHVQRAEQGWEQAVHWDSRLSEGHERLAFMHDLRGQLQEAEVAYLRAEKLVPIRSDLAKRYRNGRANVLAQQPERRQEALDLFDADRDYPRSAIEAAMVRWGNPASVGQASDALEDPSMRQRLADESKTSAGTGSWGFKTSNELLMFHTAAQKRCLLATARAAGRHLLGDERAAADLRPGAKGDCEGIQFQTLELICSRLLQALAGRTPAGSGNPRAAITARWLSCSSPAATTASS